MSIEDVTIGDRVEWLSPGEQGTVVDVDYCAIQIQWDDGGNSIERKADGFVGWRLLEKLNGGAA